MHRRAPITKNSSVPKASSATVEIKIASGNWIGVPSLKWWCRFYFSALCEKLPETHFNHIWASLKALNQLYFATEVGRINFPDKVATLGE